MNLKNSLLGVVAVFGVSFSVNALANPISIMGLDVAMSIGEITQEMEKRGFSCLRGEKPDADGELKFTCEKEEKTTDSKPARVLFYSDAETDVVTSIEFSCAALNLCAYGLRESGQLLVDNVGGVDSLEPRGIPMGYAEIPAFCTTGRSGDEICLLPDFEAFLVGEALSSTGAIWIKRHRYGEKKPSFR